MRKPKLFYAIKKVVELKVALMWAFKKAGRQIPPCFNECYIRIMYVYFPVTYHEFCISRSFTSISR